MQVSFLFIQEEYFSLYYRCMSHAIYQTRALVLKTENSKESNKIVYLYTEKFGLLVAHMQSLRELRSKMRYHIHPLSLLSVDLVSGKNIWHITGVHEGQSSFTLAGSPWFRLATLFSETLVRLCGHEEVHEGLFSLIEDFFAHTTREYEEYISEIEIIFLIHLLNVLGYFRRGDDFFSYSLYSQELFSRVRERRSLYIKQINEALRNSQL